MNELTAAIDKLLSERRPDRYEAEASSEWLDDIAAEVAWLIPEDDARYKAARFVVGRREGEKTKSANKLLREIHDTKQWPLGWLDMLNLPIAVGKERVALRAVTSADLRQFANDERRAAASDFSVRNATCEAAEWMADIMDANGYRFGSDIEPL
jgi:hypothetical protein